jgi:hypothetical protein
MPVSNLRFIYPNGIDPAADIKLLDAIIGRKFTFDYSWKK